MSWGKINWGSGTKGSANCYGLEIFHADATDETRICHNKNLSFDFVGTILVLSASSERSKVTDFYPLKQDN